MPPSAHLCRPQPSRGVGEQQPRNPILFIERRIMKQELTFESEPFQGYTDFDEFEFRPVDPELFEAEAAFEWMGEVSRSNPEYIRWIQQSLNKILSLQLKVEGISGPQTRSAV